MDLLKRRDIRNDGRDRLHAGGRKQQLGRCGLEGVDELRIEHIERCEDRSSQVPWDEVNLEEDKMREVKEKVKVEEDK